MVSKTRSRPCCSTLGGNSLLPSKVHSGSMSGNGFGKLLTAMKVTPLSPMERVTVWLVTSSLLLCSVSFLTKFNPALARGGEGGEGRESEA